MAPRSYTVLYVDDEASLRELVKEYLERENPRLTITTESSAAAGLERVESDVIDCLVSDYEMPGMNGLAFLKEVRSAHGDLPFVMYTGKGSEELAEKAINAGVDAYYQKETGTGQYAVLAKQILTLVEKHTAEQRLERLVRDKHVADGGAGLNGKRRSSKNRDSISMTVVREIAAREGVDPVALDPPLSESLDPEALDALFPQQPAESTQGVETLTFSYQGYDVTLSKGGEVTLDESN